MSWRTFELTAGGHAASGAAAMYEEADTDGNAPILMKPLDAWELDVYQNLETTFAQDPVRRFIPSFHGIVERDSDAGARFLRLDNLLHGTMEPKVMDVKLGTRTFLQEESENTKTRADLFTKALPTDSASRRLASKDFLCKRRWTLTEGEIEEGAITKYRYMEMRDSMSTTGSHGFRIEGKGKASMEPIEDFREFAESLGAVNPASVARKLVRQLKQLRAAMQASEFVRHHEIIGTSVLFIVDASSGTCRVAWIDFAKVRAVSSESSDGLLVGLDNLISTWAQVANNFLPDEKNSCALEPRAGGAVTRPVSVGSVAGPRWDRRSSSVTALRRLTALNRLGMLTPSKDFDQGLRPGASSEVSVPFTKKSALASRAAWMTAAKSTSLESTPCHSLRSISTASSAVASAEWETLAVLKRLHVIRSL